MIELTIGWLIFWLWLASTAGAAIGFGLCSCLVMASNADDAIEQMHKDEANG